MKQSLLENQIQFALSNLEFILLSFTTVLIAAGGYIINDIYDVEIDKINKADRLIVGKFLSVKSAYFLYYFTLVSAILIAGYLAFTEQRLQLLWIPPSICLLLFAYAKYFKRGFLFGNIIVSIFVAAVPAIVILGESKAMSALTKNDFEKVAIISSYVLFAFIINLLREIVKDMEDEEGDKAMGCKTLPIVLGIKKTRHISVTISIALILSLLGGLFYGINYFPVALNVFIVCISLLLAYTTLKLLQVNKKEAFHQISNLLKVAMFLALLGLIFYL